ncbi:hypothetical protein T10_619 [Trichinella papuae]|uniref:Uncharacterized protein n=1 Tax=Trichinella papuae TaxID=268474 RepID=A0A0V1M9C6_9BILA|nr:hypothetical protein T10_619 [Trichinella papuae]
MEYSRFYRYLHWNEFVLQSFFKLAADRVQWSIKILLAVVEMQLCQQSRPGISSAVVKRLSAIIDLFSIVICQIPCGMSISEQLVFQRHPAPDPLPFKIWIIISSILI